MGLVLSERELRLVRQAGEVSDPRQETLIDILAPGQSAYELASHIKKGS